MALRIRYVKAKSFQNHSIMYRKSGMRKWVFPILSDLSGAYFSVTNVFVFTPESFYNFYVMKQYEYEKQ